MERETLVRRRVLAVFNKTESDFPDVEAYYEYEEEREQISE